MRFRYKYTSYFLCLGFITCMHKCSYAVRDFVLLLACGDCPDDGLLLFLCFEEGSLLPVVLGCSSSPPLDGFIGPKRDGLSHHTRSLHLNLCSSKLESCARDACAQFDCEIIFNSTALSYRFAAYTAYVVSNGIVINSR